MTTAYSSIQPLGLMMLIEGLWLMTAYEILFCFDQSGIEAWTKTSLLVVLGSFVIFCLDFSGMNLIYCSHIILSYWCQQWFFWLLDSTLSGRPGVPGRFLHVEAGNITVNWTGRSWNIIKGPSNILWASSFWVLYGFVSNLRGRL